jgi:hypothetical protein
MFPDITCFPVLIAIKLVPRVSVLHCVFFDGWMFKLSIESNPSGRLSAVILEKLPWGKII